MSSPSVDTTELNRRLSGTAFGPGDPEFSGASDPWNTSFSHKPTVVIAASEVQDVVEAIRFAGAHDLKVAIQATGHGVTSPADGALLILTRALSGVVVDEERRSAKVGGGVTWEPVLNAAADVGLAPLLGSSPHTGAVGFTLGGGFGWLGRRYGMASDHVRSFTVVLADGSIVKASAESEGELFWALRGGGSGSLGVIVEMEIGLVPVGTVYGGNLFYPIEVASDVFDRYCFWSEGLSDDFTTSFDIVNFPPIEIVPEPLRGRAFAVVRGCHCGDPEVAGHLVDRWREWLAPEIDTFMRMPFREVASISQDPVDPLPALTSARWLNGLGPDVFEAMYEAVLGGDGPSPILFVEARHGGGAMGRAESDGSYVLPEADRLLQVVGVTPEPEARREAERRAEVLWQRVTPQIDSVYLNLMEGDERRSQTRNAFDFASWARLVEVKRRVDPNNVFAHGLDLTS